MATVELDLSTMKWFCLLIWSSAMFVASSAYGVDINKNVVLQDAFCFNSPDVNDTRYNIKSFALVHQKLYIFTPITFFVTDPQQKPPFRVSHGNEFQALSNQRTNVLYHDEVSFRFMYTSLGIEIDQDNELFIFGIASGVKSYSTHLFRNRNSKFQDPSQYEAIVSIRDDFKGYDLYDSPLIYHSRFLSGDKFFYYVGLYPNDTIKIFRYDVKDGLKFRITEYNIFKIYEYYFFDSIELINKTIPNAVKVTDGRFVNNGFFSGDHLYVSNTQYVDVYDVAYPMQDQKRIQLVFNRSILASQFITCKLQDQDNYSFEMIKDISIIYVVFILFVTLFTGVSRTMSKAKKYIIGPNLTLLELTDNLLYRNKHFR